MKIGAPIEIGIPYTNQQQSSAVITAVGGKGLAGLDDKTIYTLLINRLNAQGGILGRRLKPVFYEINVNGATQSQLDSEACATFTQDHHVLVATANGANGLDHGYFQCMTAHGAAVLDTGWSVQLGSQLAQMKYAIQPNAMALDRLAKVLADQLVAMGYFAKPGPAKVGVLYYDDPIYAAAEQVLERSLAAHGITGIVKVSAHPVRSVADLGATQGDAQSAVLKFRAQGVNHVLFMESSAWLSGFFGIYSSSQGYYPRYGYHSNESPDAIASNVPTKGLTDAVFVGWAPSWDVGDPNGVTAQGKACLTYLAKQGQAAPTGNNRYQLTSDCEAISFIAAALTAAGGSPSRDSLVAGARKVAPSYASANTFRIALGPSRYDGASAVRRGAFQPSCSCFAYTSGVIPLG